ncbi:MAG: hypothetical protein KDA41_09280 [Planctomycetales bacterium]|nr:hypothetical protein [Planctomycetales bacterium]
MKNNHGNDRPILSIQDALEEPLPTQEQRRLYRRIYVEGRFPQQVAAEFGMSVAQVLTAARRVARWFLLVQPMTDAQDVAALHLHRLEHQWQEAMQAWHRSGQQEEVLKVSYEGAGQDEAERPTTSTGAKSRGKEAKQKFEKVTRGPCGDVRYLEQARRIMAEYRALCAELQSNDRLSKESSHDDSVDGCTKGQARSVVTLRERERDADAVDDADESLDADPA